MRPGDGGRRGLCAVAETERGAALLVAIMTVAFLSTVGAALVLLTSSESAIAANFQSGAEVLYAADAMLGRAIRDLRALPDWTPALNGSASAPFVDGSTSGVRPVPGGAAIDLDEVVNQANCRRSTACTPADLERTTSERPWGANNPRWRVFACGTLASLLGSGDDTGLYVVALIGDDGAENDSDPERDGVPVGPAPNVGLGVVELRAEAFGAHGIRRTVQATLVRYLAISPAGPVPEVRILAWREVR